MSWRAIHFDIPRLSSANYGNRLDWRCDWHFHCRNRPSFNGDRVITIYFGATCYFYFPATAGCSWWFWSSDSLYFTLLPLSRARDIRASQLFRALITPPTGLPPISVIIRIIAAGIALTILALIATKDVRLTFGFIGGALMALALLALLGEGVMRLMRRLPSPSYVPARLALSAITRQGSPLRAIIIAFAWTFCIGGRNIDAP